MALQLRPLSFREIVPHTGNIPRFTRVIEKVVQLFRELSSWNERAFPALAHFERRDVLEPISSSCLDRWTEAGGFADGPRWFVRVSDQKRFERAALKPGRYL